MTFTTAPRSVSDATRFTPTTLHASSKPGSGSASTSQSRFPPPSGSARRQAPASSSGGGGPPTETPEQRVARLRAAHLAARNMEVSRFDRFLAGSRSFLDSTHKFTVLGLIGFTAIAGLATVYTTFDMLRYNRKRKAEFLEAQKKMQSDSLEAARLAYMKGEATDDQIALVEEANAHATGEGGAGIFKVPSLLGSPAPIDRTDPEGAGSEGRLHTGATWPSAAEEGAAAKAAEKKAPGGIRSWFSSTLKKEEEGEDVGSSERRLGWESLSEEDDGAGVRDSDLVRAVEERQAYLKDKARQAFEREKENQRKGGPLDRLGLEGAAAGEAAAQAPKKSWWRW